MIRIFIDNIITAPIVRICQRSNIHCNTMAVSYIVCAPLPGPHLGWSSHCAWWSWTCLGAAFEPEPSPASSSHRPLGQGLSLPPPSSWSSWTEPTPSTQDHKWHIQQPKSWAAYHTDCFTFHNYLNSHLASQAAVDSMFISPIFLRTTCKSYNTRAWVQR